MKREWHRRAQPRPWLLLRPGDTWDWALLDNGTVQREGQGQPPASLVARVALIVPGEQCSQFQLAAPPGLKRDEWPLLLEDQLMQGPDEVHCACLSRHAGQLRLLVVARERLHAWRRQCAQWGVQVDRCWAEFQLLPTPEPGLVWQWQRAPGTTLYKGRGDDDREHWLLWPAVLGDTPQLPWLQQRTVPLAGAWPTALAPLDSLPSLFEQPRTAHRWPAVPRHQQRLIAACLVLAAGWGGLWLSQQWRQAQVWRAQVQAVAGNQASPQQAAQALKHLRDSERQQQLHMRQLQELQAQVQAWLHDHPGWRLHAARFDGQRWYLRLDGEGSAPPWAEMASAAGATVQVQDAASHVVFDLGAAT